MSERWLTTRQVAEHLGVSTAFVRGEIQDGRLPSHAITRSGKRTIYRVSLTQFRAYCSRHWSRPKMSAESV